MAFIRRKDDGSKKGKGYSFSPEAMNPPDIRSFAEENGIRLFPLDVERLAESLGLSVNYEAMDDELSGYLEKRRNGWVIGVNSLHNPKRQRFTIAHELAHYFLHGNEKNKFEDVVLMKRTSKSDQMEVDADHFAGELLMPEAKFRGKIDEGVTSIKSLSEYFGTSMMAVKYKAGLLGYKFA